MSLSKENKVVIDGMTFYGGLNQPNLKFVKVTVDCWEKIFDYLSLEDIIAMSGTCQRMRQIGGHYFRENFHGAICEIEGSYFPHFRSNCYSIVHVSRNDFLRFIDTVRIYDGLERLQDYSSGNLLGSVTTLRLREIDLRECELHRFSNILNNVETIEIFDGVFDENSTMPCQFLDLCPKLKCLRIQMIDFRANTTENTVFERTYPMLTDFQCLNSRGTTPPLTAFLERNSSIKNLRIACDDLRKISFNTSTIRLDCLSVDMIHAGIQPTEFRNRISALLTNGNIKTLRLAEGEYIFDPDYNYSLEMFINELAWCSALEVLYAYQFSANIRHLTGLKELHIGHVIDDINFEAVAKNLPKLERLWIQCTVDQFLPFLRHTKSLKMAILDDFRSREKPLNLCNLNEARKMSGTKRKVKIGVLETVYLPTKWKANTLDYDFVEITRSETICEHFDYNDLHEPVYIR